MKCDQNGQAPSHTKLSQRCKPEVRPAPGYRVAHVVLDPPPARCRCPMRSRAQAHVETTGHAGHRASMWGLELCACGIAVPHACAPIPARFKPPLLRTGTYAHDEASAKRRAGAGGRRGGCVRKQRDRWSDRSFRSRWTQRARWSL